MKSTEKNSKIQRKHIVFTACIVLILIAGTLSGILIPLLNNRVNDTELGNDGISSPVSAQSVEKIESIRDASRDFTFDVVSNTQLTNENLSNHVTVVDSHKKPIAVSVLKKGDYYTISPPISLYDAGEFYTVTLSGAKFKDERLKDNNGIMFATTKESVEKFEYKEAVRNIDENKVVSVEDGYIELVNDRAQQYAVGDILIIKEENDGFIEEVAYKVDTIVADNGDVSILGISQPVMDEVYAELEIYGSYDPKLEDVQFFAEEEIIKQVKNSESVQAMSYAVAIMNGETSAGAKASDWNVSGNVDIDFALPQYLPSDIKLSIKGVKISPFEMDGSIQISWDIKDKEVGGGNVKLSLTVTVTVGFSIKVENFTNCDKEKNTYSTGTITTSTLTVGAELEFESKFDSKKLQKEEILDNLPLFINGYDATWAVKSLAEEERYARKKDENGKYTFDKDGNAEWVKDPNGSFVFNDNTNTYKRSFSIDTAVNNFNRDSKGRYMKMDQEYRDATKKQLLDLIEKYKAPPSTLRSDIIPLVNIPIPLPYGCAINIKIGIGFSIDFRAAFGATYTLQKTSEKTNVTTEDGTKAYDNDSSRWDLSVYLTGSLEIKLGIALDVKVTLLKIFYVSATFEIGDYLTLSGTLAVCFGDAQNAEMFKNAENADGAFYHNFSAGSSFVGFGNAELGAYFNFKLQAGLHINLGIVTIDVSGKLEYDKKWPIVKMGVNPETYSDLVTESEIAWSLNEAERTALFKENKLVVDDHVYDDTYIKNCAELINNTYVMDNTAYSLGMPKVIRRTVDLTNAEITYEYIQYERLKYTNNEAVSISNDGLIYQRYVDNPTIDDLIFITAKDQNGNIDGEEFFSFKIEKEPIKVDNIGLSTDDGTNETFVESVKMVLAKISPSNASYKDCLFTVESVQRDEILFTGADVSKYAYFNNTNSSTYGELVTTWQISVGDIITVKATAIADDIESLSLPIHVVRRPVDSVSLVTQNRQTTVVIGQELPFDLFVYPTNATFNLEGGMPTIEVKDPDLATIVYRNDNPRLVVTEDASAFGKTITLLISLLDGQDREVTAEFSLRIVSVSIDTIKIYDNSLVEISPRTTLNQGQSLQLISIASPQDATVLDKINLLKSVNNEFVTIDDNGLLTIAENAPIGFSFEISARCENVNGQIYKFVVEKIPVTNVNLFAQNGQYTVVPSQKLMLKTTVQPLNATYSEPTFVISEGSEYATIAYNGLVTINDTAPIGAKIVIHAIVDGQESNSVELTIPLAGIQIYSIRSTLIIGESIQLAYDLLPTNNSLEAVIFSIVSGREYASITESGLLTIRDDVAVSNAQIRVSATCSGSVSNIIIIDIKVPVNSVELFSDATNDALQLGNSTILKVKVSPIFATTQDVEFEIVSNAEYASISNNYITVSSEQVAIGQIVEVIARVDGVVSNIYHVRIQKVFVLFVEFDESLQDEEAQLNVDVAKGSSKTLFAQAYPVHATYNAVGFRIVNGLDLGIINGNILTVLPNAPIGSKIEIVASADGVDSFEILVVNVLKVAADEVKLSAIDSLEKVLPFDVIRFTATVLPTETTYSNVNYRLVGGLSYAQIDSESGILTISDFDSFDRGDIVFSVFAIADGKESNRIEVRVFVPTRSILINASNYEPIPNETIDLNNLVNMNSTDKSVIFQITEGQQYAAIVGNQLVINDSILLPNAIIKVKAFAQGVESNEIVLNVHIAVTSVIITSNLSNIILGDTAHLNVSVAPIYATYSQAELKFVDKDGNILSNSPYGVTLDSNAKTIRVADNVELLNSPFFYIRAYADGASSNILAFRIVKHPATSIEFNTDRLLTIYNSTGYYEVNPNTKHQALLQARINADATNQGITFKVAAFNSTDIEEINDSKIYLLNGYYCVDLNVFKMADIDHQIIITAQSLDNPSLRKEIIIEITPIYAETISGGNVSNGSNLLWDGVPPVNIDGRTGIYISPSDSIRFNHLYFDDEVKASFKNVTFDYNYSITLNTSSFVSSVDSKGFVVKSKIALLSILKKGEDSFTVTVTLQQKYREDIKYNVTFIIYILVESVEFMTGNSADGIAAPFSEVTRTWEVNRNNGTTMNEFTLRFSLNNNSFVTKYDLSKVDAIKLQVISGDLSKKTYPEIAVKEESDYSNTIIIKFKDWYNYGVKFRIVINNPDGGIEGNKELFGFELSIKPLNPLNSIVTFSKDGTTLSDGFVQETSGDKKTKSYQVVIGTGPISIGGERQYADLRMGYYVNLIFGTGNTGLGTSLAYKDVTYNGYPKVSVVSKELGGAGDYIFAEEVGSTSHDSYIINKLLKVSVTYQDGEHKYEQSIYIRIVRILDDGFVVKRDNTNISSLSVDLTEAPFDYQGKGIAYYSPMFTLDSTANAYISNGKTLYISNSGMTGTRIAEVNWNFAQSYNGVSITTSAGTDILYRRFITTTAQFRELATAPNTDGEYKLLKDINMYSEITYQEYTGISRDNTFYWQILETIGIYPDTVLKTWIPIKSLRVSINGNGKTLQNLSLYIPGTEYDSDRYFGIFEEIGSNVTVKDLKISNLKMTFAVQHSGAYVWVGGLAAVNNGTVNNIEVQSGTISVDRKDSVVGSIVGLNQGMMTQCVNRADIRGNGDIGGVLGRNAASATIENSKNYGNISLYYNAVKSVGGIVGYNMSNGNVRNCNNYGYLSPENKIEGEVRMGAIIGHNAGNFDGVGSKGSWYAVYTQSNGTPLFHWGSYDNGRYLFANYDGRVGKQD
jgi:hypothetical protein